MNARTGHWRKRRKGRKLRSESTRGITASNDTELGLLMTECPTISFERTIYDEIWSEHRPRTGWADSYRQSSSTTLTIYCLWRWVNYSRVGSALSCQHPRKESSRTRGSSWHREPSIVMVVLDQIILSWWMAYLTILLTTYLCPSVRALQAISSRWVVRSIHSTVNVFMDSAFFLPSKHGALFFDALTCCVKHKKEVSSNSV